MEYKHHSYPQYGVEVQLSTFRTEKGIIEHHIILHSTQVYTTYKEQLDNLHDTFRDMQEKQFNGKAIAVLKRYFLSDATNQTGMLEETLKTFSPCAVSIVQQPPLDGTKVVLWVYLQEGVEACEFQGKDSFSLVHNGYTHFWTAYQRDLSETSEQQTRVLLENYESYLNEQGCNIVDNCVRTWFFVHDVDVNYAGVVKGRRENFDKVGLTKDTHYIASTGIEGRHADAEVKVLLDAYAVKGLETGQMTYLYAPTHLNPTYEYGVTFERGVCMEYGDRKQLYISGTASIDNHGNVLHLGDIVAQTHRMWENVEKLLEERGTTFDDLAEIIVYLRDVADYPIVKRLFEERLPHVPTTIVLAPVCRPTWLIEMECIAIKESNNPEFRDL